MSAQVHHVTHPLVQHKLTLMRNKDASSTTFRTLLGELAMLMAYEVTRDTPTQLVEIETPLEKMTEPHDRRQEAGVRLHPARRQRHAGRPAARWCPTPASATSACTATRPRCGRWSTTSRCPTGMAERDVIVVDPMLATGHSAVAAIDALKAHPAALDQVPVPAGRARGHPHAARRPPGRADLHRRHRPRLNEHGYILPGLGDAGDRIFGTK
jgi:uracil phosphoribosyltransferase